VGTPRHSRQVGGMHALIGHCLAVWFETARSTPRMNPLIKRSSY
jgi:hypothetical protein